MEHQQRSRPGRAGPDAGAAAGTWEAIEPYQIRPGSWRGRAQVSDGHTTQSELCDHPGLSDSHPGHDDQSAAWACGQELAATLRAERIALDSTAAGQVRTVLEGEYPAGMVTDAMVRSTVHGVSGGGPRPACPYRHSYVVADPGEAPPHEGAAPPYEGTDFERAWQAALGGVTSLGRLRARVTASHGDTRPCPEQESRVRRAALASWLARQDAATAGDPAQAGPGAGPPGPERTPRPAAIAIGELVISWNHDRPMQYGGPGDSPWEEVSFGLADTSAPTLKCELRHIAPARTPIPAQDTRVTVSKRPRAEKPEHAPGDWRLTLPGVPRPSWHPTKREATATGLRQLAILDWHAAREAQQAGEASPAAAGQPVALDEDRYLTRDY